MEIPKEVLNLHKIFIDSLTPEQHFILKKWSVGAFDVINSFLRGYNTLETYKSNIFMRYNKNLVKYPLWLFELDPSFKNIFTKNQTVSNDVKEKYNTIYPTLAGKTLNDFKKLTFEVTKKLYTIVKNAPHFPAPFSVFRGTEENYLSEDPGKISTLYSFYSTTTKIGKTRAYGDVQLIFNVHPNASYLWIKPVAEYKNEEEILIGPGNRFLFHKKEGNIISYYVLPPEDTFTFLTTFEEFDTFFETSRLFIRNITQKNRDDAPPLVL